MKHYLAVGREDGGRLIAGGTVLHSGEFARDVEADYVWANDTSSCPL